MTSLEEAVICRGHPKRIILALLANTHERYEPLSDMAGSRLRLLQLWDGSPLIDLERSKVGK